MGKKLKRGKTDALERLLGAADAETLRRLVRNLVTKPEIRRACLEFLRKEVRTEAAPIADTDGEIVCAMWDELQPELDELDQYGGGDYDAVDRVGEQIYELSKKLSRCPVPVEDRRALLDEIMPYILGGNSGLVDSLYDVAYALCQDKDDWRDLASRLEASGQDWPCNHARRIYREVGDRQKYLELRGRRMEYGADYHDLATFYWESGDKDQALAVAREGLEKAKGRMDELRGFLAERAKETGDRATYLELEFAQATDRLSLDSYKKFENLCSHAEWQAYEPRMLDTVAKAWCDTQMQIHIHRKDLRTASDVLAKERYPVPKGYRPETILNMAAQLEAAFPEKVLAFYLTGLATLKHNAPRDHYAHYAQTAKRARRVWVDVLHRPKEWESFARRIKLDNIRRPAFQQEFAKVVPGWDKL